MGVQTIKLKEQIKNKPTARPVQQPAQRTNAAKLN
jgi:hypothetical protein